MTDAKTRHQATYCVYPSVGVGVLLVASVVVTMRSTSEPCLRVAATGTSAASSAPAVKAPLRIFVYDLPARFTNDTIAPNIYYHPMYDIEVALPRFLSRHPEFTTTNPEEADWYLLPIYISRLMQHNKSERKNTRMKNGRDAIKEAVEDVSTRYPYWRTRRQRHVLAITYDVSRCLFGSTNSSLWQAFAEVLVLTHLGDRHPRYFRDNNNLGSCVSAAHDLVIPPLHSVVLSSSRVVLDPMAIWPQTRTRDILASFIGTIRPNTSGPDDRYSRGVRQALSRLYAGDRDMKIRPNLEPSAYITTLYRSNFCLAPGGWQTWSPRAYIAIALGCVPVFFFAPGDVQLPWDDTLDYRDFAIFLSHGDDEGKMQVLRDLKSTLLAVDDARLRQLQLRLFQVREFFQWQLDGGDSGAMRKLMESLQRRRRP